MATFNYPYFQHGGNYYAQRGDGVGALFRKFFRYIMPIAEKHLLPKIKSGLQNIGETAVNTASNIARDAIKGKNIKQAAEEHGNMAVDVLQKQAEKVIKGEGKKRKHKKSKIYFSKKTKINDIFG